MIKTIEKTTSKYLNRLQNKILHRQYIPATAKDKVHAVVSRPIK